MGILILYLDFDSTETACQAKDSYVARHNLAIYWVGARFSFSTQHNRIILIVPLAAIFNQPPHNNENHATVY